MRIYPLLGLTIFPSPHRQYQNLRKHLHIVKVVQRVRISELFPAPRHRRAHHFAVSTNFRLRLTQPGKHIDHAVQIFHRTDDFMAVFFRYHIFGTGFDGRLEHVSASAASGPYSIEPTLSNMRKPNRFHPYCRPIWKRLSAHRLPCDCVVGQCFDNDADPARTKTLIAHFVIIFAIGISAFLMARSILSFGIFWARAIVWPCTGADCCRDRHAHFGPR